MLKSLSAYLWSRCSFPSHSPTQRSLGFSSPAGPRILHMKTPVQVQEKNSNQSFQNSGLKRAGFLANVTWKHAQIDGGSTGRRWHDWKTFKSRAARASLCRSFRAQQGNQRSPWVCVLDQERPITSLNSGLRVFFFTVVLYFDFFPMSGCNMLKERGRTEL